MIGSDFGTGQVFLSMLWFFLFFIWIWLLISVFADIFRSHDMGGLREGDLGHLRHRPAVSGRFRLLDRAGHKMSEHAIDAAQAQDAAAACLHPAGGGHWWELG